jgi:hypothetical protein
MGEVELWLPGFIGDAAGNPKHRDILSSVGDPGWVKAVARVGPQARLRRLAGAVGQRSMT